MSKFQILQGGRSVNRYNSWLNELTGILKNVKESMIIASNSESNSKKILNDLKDRFGIVIENAQIKESGIYIPKDATIVFENNKKGIDEIERSSLNFRGYYNGEFVFTKPNKQD